MTGREQTKSGDISLSVEETNRLRISLGLAPLRTKPEPSTESNAPPPEPQASNAPATSHVTTRLARSRHARQARTAALSSEPNKPVLVSEAPPLSHEEDLKAWVERSRFSAASDAVARKQNRKAKTRPIVPKVEPVPEIKQAAVPDNVQVGSVLTLQDSLLSRPRKQKPIHRSLSMHSDLDSEDTSEDDKLEDLSKEAPVKLSSNPLPNTATYDPTDNSEFLPDAGKGSTSRQNAKDKPGVQSVAPPPTKVIESDYRPAPFAKAAKFSKRREKRSRKKRKRASSPTSHASAKRTVEATVSRGHVRALRQAADAHERDDDDDIDGDDAHYTAMLQARRKSEASNMDKRVQRLLDAIQNVNEGEQGEDGDSKDEGMDRGARIMYDEMHAFLQRIPVPSSSQVQPQNGKSAKDNGLAEQNEIPQAAEQSHDLVMKGTEQDNTTNSPKKIYKEEDMGIEPVKVTTEDKMADKQPATEAAAGLSGVAGTLKRLREMGQLSRKKQKIGRSSNLHQGNNTQEEKESDVQLSYIDEFGNELSPHEAFRLLCHKFHGNGPGKNKKEKRLKKILENTLVRNMQNGDTPLASVAALKEETRKKRSAHVVLSGPQAFENVATGETTHALASEEGPRTFTAVTTDPSND